MAQDIRIAEFESGLQRAMERVQVILDRNKAPCFASEAHHTYEDKYFLVETMTNTAVASHLNTLSHVGLGQEQLAQLCEWAQASAVSLRFRSEERCRFLREETREVESPTRSVEELSVGGVVQASLTSKVVTTVTEYFWQFEVSYELSAFRGVGENPEDRLTLRSRTGRDEIKTTSKSAPKPEARVPAHLSEVNISNLLRQVAPASFRIDRSRAKTPRRNSEVEAGERQFEFLQAWAQECTQYLIGLFRDRGSSRNLDLQAFRKVDVFGPVLPLLCKAADSVQLGTEAWGALLAEEARTLRERTAALTEAFPAGDMVVSGAEAVIVGVLHHCFFVCRRWSEAVQHIEDLLWKQLAAAIGEEVSSEGFAAYMRFHNRKLFAEAFAPTPFCFAVRRSDRHALEGTVSIEQEDDGIAAPVFTLVARSNKAHPMEFLINASTTLRFGGERYLHAWPLHTFAGESGPQPQLVARARQFSSMLVLVGRIGSATVFEPKYAAIVKNKDELTIPLELATIPAPKAFKKAVESMSPEQQAFSKAIRSMQLASTLFGVLVVQIKPQLERVLNLAADSLTKEIKLTQELMQLLLEYQIPVDLLSAEIAAAPTPLARLEAVKAHVKAMQELIQQAKGEEVSERRMEARYGRQDSDSRSSGSSIQLRQRCASEELYMESDCNKEMEREMRATATDAAAGAVDCMDSAAEEDCCSEEEEECEGCAMDFDLGDEAQCCQLECEDEPDFACQEGAFEEKEEMVEAADEVLPEEAEDNAEQPEETTKQEEVDEEMAAQQQTGASAPSGPAVDYTMVPKEMDRQFERLDSDGAVRPTIITPSECWSKRAQKALLASPSTTSLEGDEQKAEKDAAFDLLDALTKSGGLPLEHASLHIIVAATHCFEQTVMETVIKENNNPIDRVERSTLIMASTVHQKPAAALINEAQRPRVTAASPMLFLAEA